MHNGVIVVRNSKTQSVLRDELTSQEVQVLFVDADVLWSIRPLLLVPQTEGVADLMDRDTELPQTIILKVDLLGVVGHLSYERLAPGKYKNNRNSVKNTPVSGEISVGAFGV